jgi:integrase
MASLVYGSGLRLLECVRLRVNDLDLDRRELRTPRTSRVASRVVPVPASLIDPLRIHLAIVREEHERDVAAGIGWGDEPDRGSDDPFVARRWSRHWVFPGTRLRLHRPTGRMIRLHFGATALQRALRRAGVAAGIVKSVTCDVLRHSFAVRLLETGCDVRRLQQLLGHRSVATTMRYARLCDVRALAVESPLDRISAARPTASRLRRS